MTSITGTRWDGSWNVEMGKYGLFLGSVEWWLLDQEELGRKSQTFHEEFFLGKRCSRGFFHLQKKPKKTKKTVDFILYLTQVQGADQTPDKTNPLIFDFT